MIDRLPRDRIASELGTNLLVEASAGSGKTYSLVSRLVTGLVDGTFSVEHLAVVTFTCKAAGELSSRLRLALEADGGPSALRALASYEQITIGTVHSFCAQILRRFPVQAGISPGFIELEEPEDLLHQRRILRASLDSPDGRKVLRLLSEVGAGVSDLVEALRALVDYGELDYPAGCCDRPELAEAWLAVDAFREFLDQNLPATEEAEPTCKMLQAGRSLLRHVGLAERDGAGDLLKLFEEWEGELKPIKKYWGSSRNEQNQRLADFSLRSDVFQQEVVRPFLFGWRTYLYSQIVPFLVRVRAACQAEREQLALVNFHDLVFKCVRLLREDPEVRALVQARFTHLLVDEFQDTDPLQAELFFLLAGAERHERDWRRVTPRPGALFLVGDPKQSIYRFRRADIETYHLVRKRLLATEGDVVSLVTSFRSDPELCDWVNGVFETLLPVEATPAQARFSALVSRGASGKVGPCVQTLTLHSERYQDVAREESEAIAAYIQQAVASGGYRYADFLVLTSRKSDLFHHRRSLARYQVPALVSCDPAWLSARGEAFVQLMHVLVNGHDKIALTGVLRGPLFGHSDEELFQHCQLHGALRLPDDPVPVTPVTHTLQTLEQWRTAIRALPAGAAARLVLERSGLRLRAALEEGTEELDSVVETFEQSGLSLSAALTELIEAARVQLLSPEIGQPDVVRVMNLHKAKGLEARVVFLAAPTSGLPLLASHAVCQGEEGSFGALCLWRLRKPLAHPADWKEVELEELKFLAAERHRLLYVAATRAKELLVVGRWSGFHGSVIGPWGDLAPFLKECPELVIPESTFAPHDESGLSAEAYLASAAAEGARREACRLPSWRRTTVSAATREGVAETYQAPPGAKGDGAAWGNLIHRMLEQMVLRPQLTRAELESLARWFTFESPELAESIPAALDTMDRIQQSALWVRVTQARERLVEVSFGQRSGTTLLLGIIDLVLAQEDGWDIVDYKTDRKRLDALVERYAAQVQQYASSWETLTEESVTFARLFSVRDNELSPDLSARRSP